MSFARVAAAILALAASASAQYACCQVPGAGKHVYPPSTCSTYGALNTVSWRNSAGTLLYYDCFTCAGTASFDTAGKCKCTKACAPSCVKLCTTATALKPYRCGNDGCGGTCGTCATGSTCTQSTLNNVFQSQVCVANAPACVPQCPVGINCGPDSCGGTCGSCPANTASFTYTCKTPTVNGAGTCTAVAAPALCTPNCVTATNAAKTCGGNGCGGYCGTVPLGNCALNATQTCSSAGLCVNTCTPACTGKQCGANGCGGTCGSCSTGSTCSTSGTCAVTPAVCTPVCSGRVCGSNGCGGSCGTCPSSTPACSTDGAKCNVVTPVCTKNCAGKTCGSDGCGGTCGSCTAGQTCTTSGTCMSTPVACVPTCTASVAGVAGTTCGLDGCGNTCGCASPNNCVASRCTAPSISLLDANPVVGVSSQFNFRLNTCAKAVSDQGQCGACWAFSTSTIAKTRMCLKPGSPGQPMTDVSQQDVQCRALLTYYSKGLTPLSTSYSSPGLCEGGDPVWGLQYVSANGAVLGTALPYRQVATAAFSTTPPSAQCTVSAGATRYFMHADDKGEYRYVKMGNVLSHSDKRVAAMQRLLAATGPVGFDMSVFYSFMYYGQYYNHASINCKSKPYEAGAGSCCQLAYARLGCAAGYKTGCPDQGCGNALGGHAMTLVGYEYTVAGDVTSLAWRVQNSWAANWADGGTYLHKAINSGVGDEECAANWVQYTAAYQAVNNNASPSSTGSRLRRLDDNGDYVDFDPDRQVPGKSVSLPPQRQDVLDIAGAAIMNCQGNDAAPSAGGCDAVEGLSWADVLDSGVELRRVIKPEVRVCNGVCYKMFAEYLVNGTAVTARIETQLTGTGDQLVIFSTINQAFDTLSAEQLVAAPGTEGWSAAQIAGTVVGSLGGAALIAMAALLIARAIATKRSGAAGGLQMS